MAIVLSTDDLPLPLGPMMSSFSPRLRVRLRRERSRVDVVFGVRISHSRISRSGADGEEGSVVASLDVVDDLEVEVERSVGGGLLARPTAVFRSLRLAPVLRVADAARDMVGSADASASLSAMAPPLETLQETMTPPSSESALRELLATAGKPPMTVLPA